MKVNLIREAEYEFNESKYTAIPAEVFTTLVGEGDITTLSDPALPKVVMFENKTDYLKNVVKYKVDTNKSIYVSNKGQIFCFLDELGENVIDEVKEDESTNTEESKGE